MCKQDISMTNEDVVKESLKTLPDEFYGEIVLQFHRGVITHTKTTATRKFNTSNAASREDSNGNSTSTK
jgi:hypothetical protein